MPPSPSLPWQFRQLNRRSAIPSVISRGGRSRTREPCLEKRRQCGSLFLGEFVRRHFRRIRPLAETTLLAGRFHVIEFRE